METAMLAQRPGYGLDDLGIRISVAEEYRTGRLWCPPIILIPCVPGVAGASCWPLTSVQDQKWVEL